jgi:hypothetical protein
MKTRFSRNLKVFVIALLALVMSLFLFDSCNQEEFVNPKTKIKIFISSSPSSDGLKAALLAETKEVSENDTVLFPRDTPSLMWAVTENGTPIKGEWKIAMIKTEFSFTPSNFNPVNNPATYFGDQIAHSFPEIGIYQISFQGTNGGEIIFYARVHGNPGKVGDEADNNYIFRMENKTVYATSTGELQSLIFVYFKFSAEQKMKSEQAYCHFFSSLKDGTEKMETIHLQKWPFSQDYYYFIIFPDKESTGQYRTIFIVSETQGFKGYIDENNYHSSWWTNYGIKFAIQ